MINMQILKSNEEWLEARKHFIGGSDASSVLGMNPFKTNVQLWEEKVGLIKPEDISDKPFVKYGHEAEPLLRELFKLDFPQYEVGYIENNLITNTKYPFAHASVDGWITEKETGRKGILEIKTTNILQSMQKEKWNGRIPDNYYCQVLWYLGVTEYDFVELKAQLKYEYSDGSVMLKTQHYHIEREDVEEDIKYLLQRGKEFWDLVASKRRPNLILNL